MPSVYAPNVVQTNFNFTYQGEVAQNTLYWLFETEPDLSDLQALTADLYAYWAAEAAPFCPTSVTLDSVEGISLDNDAAPIHEYFPTSPADGEDSLAAASNNVTISISFRSGLQGRSRRGRNYWVGLLEANITNNRLDTSVMNAIQAYYEGLISPSAAIPYAAWGVYSRISEGEPRLTGLFTPIQSVGFVNNVVDTQRGRLP